eukprot:gene25558-32030_t
MGGSRLTKEAPVFGLLFGYTGPTGLSVCESTDALYEFTHGEVIPMTEEIEKKIKLWTAVYTNYRLVGWYAFRRETSQVEKIALDQVMKATPTQGLTPLEVQNQSLLSSLNTLGKKVDVIVNYLEGVQSGRFIADQNLIRKAAKICQMLPAIDSDQFAQKFSEEINDALMVTYLSAVTRTLHNMSTTSDHYTSLYGEKRGREGGGMG